MAELARLEHSKDKCLPSLVFWLTVQVLFLDFGGHSMVSTIPPPSSVMPGSDLQRPQSYCRFGIEDNADGDFKYYLIEDDVGGRLPGAPFSDHSLMEWQDHREAARCGYTTSESSFQTSSSLPST